MGRHYLISELGIMHNLNTQYALGATQFFGWDVGHDLRGGVKLRVRRWLSPKISLDLSGGALLWSTAGEIFEYPAFMGGASLNFSEWESINVLVELMQTRHYEYSSDYTSMLYRSVAPSLQGRGIYVGYKLSSKPGFVLNVAALTAVVVILAVSITGGVYYD